ncbi:MAG: dicarboxylate/amino acid:cation symporter, partial [Planctomycetota bacterium]
VIADFGLDILFILLKYSIVVIVGLVLHVVVIYSLAIKVLGKQKIATFFRGIRPAQLIAFSTGSSSATLPVTMECTEKNLGVSREICSFALPLGATVNMDGTALYQGVSAVFIAQVYGMGLTMGQQLAVVLTATLASIGTAGTPAAGVITLAIVLRSIGVPLEGIAIILGVERIGVITLAIVLRSIGVPLEGIAIILGVERILDMCRTVVNVTGDASCAVIVASTERAL